MHLYCMVVIFVTPCTQVHLQEFVTVSTVYTGLTRAPEILPFWRKKTIFLFPFFFFLFLFLFFFYKNIVPQLLCKTYFEINRMRLKRQ